MSNIDDIFKEVLKEKSAASKKSSFASGIAKEQGASPTMAFSKKSFKKDKVTNLVDMFEVKKIEEKDVQKKPYTLVERDIYEQLKDRVIKEIIREYYKNSADLQRINSDSFEFIFPKISSRIFNKIIDKIVISHEIYADFIKKFYRDFIRKMYEKIPNEKILFLQISEKFIDKNISETIENAHKIQKFNSKQIVKISNEIYENLIESHISNDLTQKYQNLKNNNEIGHILTKIIYDQLIMKNFENSLKNAYLLLQNIPKNDIFNKIIFSQIQEIMRNLLGKININVKISNQICGDYIESMLKKGSQLILKNQVCYAKIGNKIIDEITLKIINQITSDEIKNYEKSKASMKISYEITNQFYNKFIQEITKNCYSDKIIENRIITKFLNQEISLKTKNLTNYQFINSKISKEIFENLTLKQVNSEISQNLKISKNSELKNAHILEISSKILNNFISKNITEIYKGKTIENSSEIIKNGIFDIFIENQIENQIKENIAENYKKSKNENFKNLLINKLYNEMLEKNINNTLKIIKNTNEISKEITKNIFNDVILYEILDISAICIKEYEQKTNFKQIYEIILQDLIFDQISKYICQIASNSMILHQITQNIYENHTKSLFSGLMNTKKQICINSGMIYENLLKSIFAQFIENLQNSRQLTSDIIFKLYKENIEDSLIIQLTAEICYSMMNIYPFLLPIYDSFIDSYIKQYINEVYCGYNKITNEKYNSQICEQISYKLLEYTIQNEISELYDFANKSTKNIRAVSYTVNNTFERSIIKKTIQNSYYTYAIADNNMNFIMLNEINDRLNKVAKNSIVAMNITNIFMQRFIGKIIKEIGGDHIKETPKKKHGHSVHKVKNSPPKPTASVFQINSEKLQQNSENFKTPVKKGLNLKVIPLENRNSPVSSGLEPPKSEPLISENSAKIQLKALEEQKIIENSESRINSINMELFKISSQIELQKVNSSPSTENKELAPIYNEISDYCLDSIKQNSVFS